jgi:hypothetical protein
MLPANWQELRAQWEYSHAARAILYVLALGALTLSVLGARSKPEAKVTNWEERHDQAA